MDEKKGIATLPAQDIIDLCRSAVSIFEKIEASPAFGDNEYGDVASGLRQALCRFLDQLPLLVRENEKQQVKDGLIKIAATASVSTSLALNHAALVLTDLTLRL